MFTWLRRKLARGMGVDYTTPPAIPATNKPELSVVSEVPEGEPVIPVASLRPPALPPVQVVSVPDAVVSGNNRDATVTVPPASTSTIVAPKYKTARLVRTSSSSHGTFGMFRCEDFETLTLELPWYNNRQSVSCIPKGEYWVAWTYSPRFKRNMYLVENVPNRSGIRFHSGNLGGDVLKGLKSHINGCILMGTRVGTMSGQKALLLSAPEIVRFETYFTQTKFRLLVDGVVG